MIFDYRGIRTNDNIVDKFGSIIATVRGEILHELTGAYKLLLSDPYHRLKRDGVIIPVVRANNILGAVVGNLQDEEIKEFWQHYQSSEADWDAYHYGSTFSGKLEMMQILWNQFCDKRV